MVHSVWTHPPEKVLDQAREQETNVIEVEAGLSIASIAILTGGTHNYTNIPIIWPIIHEASSSFSHYEQVLGIEIKTLQLQQSKEVTQ